MPKSEDVGIIKAQKEQYNQVEEIQSPWRKKRGTLVKLQTKDDDNEDAELEKLDEAHKKLKPIFEQVLKNFQQKQQDFEALKKLSVQDLAA